MTEAEWLTATDPTPLVAFLRGKATQRKLRLFDCACVRRIWPRLTRRTSRRAVEVAEDYADGLATMSEMVAAGEVAYSQGDGRNRPGSRTEDKQNAVLYVASITCRGDDNAGHAHHWAARAQPDYASSRAASVAHCDLLRDIFGNPFRLVTFDPRWRSEAAVSLATGIYAERAFDRMPILADALEDAGCDHADMLAHCRSNGLHVRGCWVVDLVLGKS